MTRKIIDISIILLFIVGICVAEQLISQHYFNEVNKKLDNIEVILSTTENLNEEVSYYTDDLSTYWTSKQNILSTFVNNKEIDDVGVEIEKLQTAISNNDKAKYKESLNLIDFYIKSYEYLIGINLQNIF